MKSTPTKLHLWMLAFPIAIGTSLLFAGFYTVQTIKSIGSGGQARADQSEMKTPVIGAAGLQEANAYLRKENQQLRLMLSEPLELPAQPQDRRAESEESDQPLAGLRAEIENLRQENQRLLLMMANLVERCKPLYPLLSSGVVPASQSVLIKQAVPLVEYAPVALWFYPDSQAHKSSTATIE